MTRDSLIMLAAFLGVASGLFSLYARQKGSWQWRYLAPGVVGLPIILGISWYSWTRDDGIPLAVLGITLMGMGLIEALPRYRRPRGIGGRDSSPIPQAPVGH